MTTYKLRDGSKTSDPRLGRLVQFDEKSRQYPIRAMVTDRKPRNYSWRCQTFLDQGMEGSCVGHGFAHELLALPAPASSRVVTHDYAVRKIYRPAQEIDEFPDTPPQEGTSVLAGAKIVRNLGWCDEFRFGFSFDDLILGLSWSGPAVIGINWYDGMSDTDEDGFIRPTGYLRGGHCGLVKSVHIGDEWVRFHNSWGRPWGHNGTCKIRFVDLSRLLREDGEAVFLVGRKSKPKVTHVRA